MCGRTALTVSPEDLRDAFALDETPRITPHYNVPPSQPLQVVRVLRGAPGRRLEPLRWGLIPAWAEDPKIGNRLALARVETVRTTPAFRLAIRKRRCLVAVDGFYEWQRAPGMSAPSARAGARRSTSARASASRPFFVRRDDAKPFALAGVWDRWVSKDGEVVESCAIITQPARPPVDAIHDRMPLVLEAEAWSAWLDRTISEDTLAALLAPRSPALVAYPVSSRVNDPRNDDADCAAPAPSAPAVAPLPSSAQLELALRPR